MIALNDRKREIPDMKYALMPIAAWMVTTSPAVLIAIALSGILGAMCLLKAYETKTG